MEELLERNNLGDLAPGGFAARCRSGAYICRYQNCPRAIQGFISSDLRQEHENSHAPSFRCSDSACVFFGRELKNRTAMKQHNDKYHSDDGLAAIPTSLRQVSAGPQQARSRFSLKESSSASRKRSFHTTEEDEVTSGDNYTPLLMPQMQQNQPGLLADQQQLLQQRQPSPLADQRLLLPQQEYLQQLRVVQQAQQAQMQNDYITHSMPNGGLTAQHLQQAQPQMQNPNQQPQPQQRMGLNTQQGQMQVCIQGFYNKAMQALTARHGGNAAAITPQEQSNARRTAIERGTHYFQAQQALRQEEQQQQIAHIQPTYGQALGAQQSGLQDGTRVQLDRGPPMNNSGGQQIAAANGQPDVGQQPAPAKHQKFQTYVSSIPEPSRTAFRVNFRQTQERKRAEEAAAQAGVPHAPIAPMSGKGNKSQPAPKANTNAS